jgi:membrane fusion protein (multidrug efflux system)
MTDPHEVTRFSRRRGRDIRIGLLIGFCTLALVVWAAFHNFRTNQLYAKALHLSLPVEVSPATVRTDHFTIGASGTVQPDTMVIMTARDAARVLQVPVDLGYVVKKDDLLAALDDSVFVATLESAKATALQADNQLMRMEALLKKGYSSPADTEKARSDAVAARQAVVQAEIDLANTKIRSPAVAVVLSRTVNPGENTAINQQLFQLGTIEDVMMVAEVSEDQIGFVTLGMRAEVGTNAFPGETFVGQVVKIAADEIAATRTFGVYIRIANKDLRLKPGMTGYARIVADRTALAVISTALVNPVGDHATVFVVDERSVAHIRQVRYGLMAEGLTEIKDGLQKGERVVTVGQQELKDGDRVRANQDAPWSNK